jgi:RNA polymerase-binding transcription factor DksA
MTRNQRRRIETQLQQERERAERLLQTAEEDREFDRSTSDRADIATIAMEQAAGQRVIAIESAAVREIDQALTQLETHPEQYGRCTFCGERIAKARLALLPTTKYCATHAPND